LRLERNQLTAACRYCGGAKFPGNDRRRLPGYTNQNISEVTPENSENARSPPRNNTPLLLRNVRSVGILRSDGYAKTRADLPAHAIRCPPPKRDDVSSGFVFMSWLESCTVMEETAMD